MKLIFGLDDLRERFGILKQEKNPAFFLKDSSSSGCSDFLEFTVLIAYWRRIISRSDLNMLRNTSTLPSISS